MRRRWSTSRPTGRAQHGGVVSATPPTDLDGTDFDDPDLDDSGALKKRKAAARNTAIGLLARREHAQAEIKRKLSERGYDDDITSEVVDELTRQRLLSDERFAESFIRARADRGQGPVRLRAELRQLQLPGELIEQRLAAAQMDWCELARAVRERRFGLAEPGTLSERAKQVRFLQYRGFTADQIRAAMAHTSDEVDELLLADDS